MPASSRSARQNSRNDKGQADSTVNYSSEFKSLISDPEKVRKLIEGSHVSVADFKAWEEMRYFITTAIDRDGALLDIGCANGFLLRCLQEWIPNQLTPYGIDTDDKLIEEAKKLFPGFEENFGVLDISKLGSLTRAGLPKKFDFVYWNVWDNWNLSNPNEIKSFNEAQKTVKPGGRLILGFYHAKKENNLERIKNLQKLNYHPTQITENPLGSSEVVVWFDL